MDKGAVAITQLRDEFLRTINHELRTPLIGIIGATELLLETPLSPEQRELASIIRQSGDQLQALLDALLEYAELRAGKVVLNEDIVDLRLLVAQTIAAHSRVAEAKHLQLRGTISDAVPPRLGGDSARLQRVLNNLVSNAVKFTEQGFVEVDVMAEPVTATEQRVRFAVRDTGIGLSVVVGTQLFQPFTQADSSTTRRYGGVGLGLVIARQLVELMQGTIGVESVEGEGSTFWFTVPLARHPNASEAE